jgi:predicted  nucleic acid-binding Zn-ribbon protein
MSDPNDTGNSKPAASDPVTQAQTDAAQAQAEADKALADPQADLNQLLDSLRTIEVELYGIQVVDEVQQLSDTEKQEFVAARLHLTSVINQLNTAQLSDIADKLEQKSGELRDGIQSLQKSLDTLTGAAGWASAVNGIIGVIGQVIPLL